MSDRSVSYRTGNFQPPEFAGVAGFTAPRRGRRGAGFWVPAKPKTQLLWFRLESMGSNPETQLLVPPPPPPPHLHRHGASPQTDAAGGTLNAPRRRRGPGRGGRRGAAMAVRAPNPPQSPAGRATGATNPPGSPPPRPPAAGAAGLAGSGSGTPVQEGPAPAWAGEPFRRTAAAARTASPRRRRSTPPPSSRGRAGPRPPRREGARAFPSSPADVDGEARPSARRAPANARLTRGPGRAKRRRNRRPGSRRSRASRRARR